MDDDVDGVFELSAVETDSQQTQSLDPDAVVAEHDDYIQIVFVDDPGTEITLEYHGFRGVWSTSNTCSTKNHREFYNYPYSSFRQQKAELRGLLPFNQG